MLFGFIMYGTVNIISTFYHDGVISTFIFPFIKLLTMFLYVEVMIIYYRIDWNCIYIPLKILLWINIVCRFLYPEGMYTMIGANGRYYSNQVWLLGGKNAYLYYLILLLLLHMIISSEKPTKNTFKDILESIKVYILVYVNAFWLSGSVTTIIGVLMLTIFFFLEKRGGFRKKKNVVIYIGLSIYMFYSLILNNNSYLLRIVSDLTGKDTTFTNRTYIWVKSIEQIKEHLFWGHGYEFYEITVNAIGQATTHNKYLSVIYRGGIIAEILFICFLAICIKEIFVNYNNQLTRKLSGIVFIILIAWLVEVYDHNCIIFLIFLLCFHIKEVINRTYGLGERIR